MLREDEVAGSFSVLVDGVEWLGSGAAPSFHHDGKWATLTNHTYSRVSGADGLGTFVRTEWQWRDMTDESCQWATAARVYEDAIVFEQTWTRPCGGGPIPPSSWPATATGDKEALLGAFPTFGLKEQADLPRAFLQYGGDMTGAGYKTGKLDASSMADGIGSGITGTAPLVLFSTDLRTTLTLSPFSNFMAASQRFTPPVKDGAGATLGYGIMGDRF